MSTLFQPVINTKLVLPAWDSTGAAPAARRALLAYGQSNMEGHEPGTSLASNQQIAALNLGREFTNTWMQNRATGNLEKLHFGVNQYGGAPMDGIAADGSFGFELGLADAVERNRPGSRLDIVKYGLGGRTVDQLSKGAGNGYYEAFLTAALALKATYQAAGVSWVPDFLYNQGESGGAYPDWAGKVKQLFDDLTTDGALVAASPITVVIPQGSVEGNVPAMRANALSLASLDSRVRYVDAAQYNLVDAYHYDAFSYYQHGAYDLYNTVYGLPHSAPSYISAPQSYSTTDADYQAKCISGTSSPVGRTRQAASYVSKSDAAALSLAAATTAAKNAIVCNVVVPATLAFTGPNAFAQTPRMTGIRTVAFVFSAPTPADSQPNYIFFDSRIAANEAAGAYLDKQEGAVGIRQVWAAGQQLTLQPNTGLAGLTTGNLIKVVFEFPDPFTNANVALNFLRRGIAFGGAYYGLSGALGQIQVYSRQWTDAEKADASFTMPTDSLLAKYDFAGLTAGSTILPDSSGNGRDGTLSTS